MNPDGIYIISERPDGIYLMSTEGLPYVATADSRKEMDRKLASMGLEARWEDDIGFVDEEVFYMVRRIR